MLCHMRHLGAALSIAAVVVLLSGCHSNPGQPVSPTASPPTSSASASPTPAGVAVCTRDSVKITYQATDSSAGHFHGQLNFMNTSAATCTMNGYPIVYIGQPGAESPMGAASTNDTNSAPSLVTLAPGATAHAATTITDAGMLCDPVNTTYLIAAPPLGHPFDSNSDSEQVDNVIGSGCNDATVSLVQVGAITL